MKEGIHPEYKECKVTCACKMVRIIAGMFIEVGSGRMDAEDIENIIRSKERNRARHTAPPQGLFLADIYY